MEHQSDFRTGYNTQYGATLSSRWRGTLFPNGYGALQRGGGGGKVTGSRQIILGNVRSLHVGSVCSDIAAATSEANPLGFSSQREDDINKNDNA